MVKEIREATHVEEGKPSGKTDAELFEHFSSGRVQRGSILEVASPTIPLTEGKGVEVILYTSVAHNIPGLKPDIEHLVFSDDQRVTTMIQKGLTHWRVVGKVPEEEIYKRSAEVANNQDPDLIKS